MTHDREPQVSYRRMEAEDVALVHRWRTLPHVVEWWGEAHGRPDDASAIEAVLARDQPSEPGVHHVDPWILEVDGRPVGWLESYRVDRFDDYAPGHVVPHGTVAIDLSLGDPDAVGRGLGRRLIRCFLAGEVLPALPAGAQVWIDPNPRNRRAVRCYAAVGFADTGIDLPDEEFPGEVRRLMVLTPAPAGERSTNR